MAARRAIGNAMRCGDEAALKIARRAVNDAKVALGERGPVWWRDGAEDYTRHLIGNTPYARWYADAIERIEMGRLARTSPPGRARRGPRIGRAR
jgi:hypothetical protein